LNFGSVTDPSRALALDTVERPILSPLKRGSDSVGTPDLIALESILWHDFSRRQGEQ
jgi:hypothetical protein